MNKVLVTYEFVHNNTIYNGYREHIGDTTSPRVAKNKDYSTVIVCRALKTTAEELGKQFGVKYWDINRSILEAHGFFFNRLDIEFYPPPER